MIYLLEDDSGIRSLVLYALNNSGLPAEGFETPSEFYEALRRQIPELLLLDIMLPEEDGLSILRKLRSSPATRKLPIIMLTAKGTEYDKVAGLDSGADDYVTKPFGAMELISRVRALLRRSAPSEEEVCIGALSVNPERREVTADGSPVTLTMKEFDLLLMLMRNRGKVYSRDELLSEVWGYDFKGESRTVDVHIRTLRAKLGDCGDMIQTVRGVGYRIGADND